MTEEIKQEEYRNGEPVKFTLAPNVYGTGVIVGVAARLADSTLWIIKIETREGTGWSDYPYNCITVPGGQVERPARVYPAEPPDGYIQDSIYEPTPKLWSNGMDTVVAFSIEHAKEILRQETGMCEEEIEAEGWYMVEPGQILWVRREGYKVPLEATARTFADLHPVGILCSREW